MEKQIAANLGRNIQVVRKFQMAMNGMTVKLTPDEAIKLANLPGVAKVFQDVVAYPNTDRGPSFINAPSIWDGSASGIEALGEGMVVGILDTGINGYHPSFAEIGGDGYVHVNPLGEGVFLGECDQSNSQFNPAIACNNKLIGRYVFLDNRIADPNDSEDVEGHGSHVTSIAAGNFVEAPFFNGELDPSGLTVNISGVAPHANIVIARVCNDGCSSNDRVAAVEQMIADGVVDVINHSIGSSVPVTFSPWENAVEQAFLQARAAGIGVHNSVGNNGPEPATSGSANPPWTTNSGNFSHDRVIESKDLFNLTSSGSPLPEIEGRSISGAHGPATIVYARDFDNGDDNPEQCLNPFPAGTWTNDEIVVCDRGDLVRVVKCINVREGGAGGCVLTNIDGGATSVNDDAHVIPAINIDSASGNALKAWLDQGDNHMATISNGLVPWSFDPNAIAIAATNSSRGPYTGQDYLPVSLGAPGTRVYAAFDDREYNFLSGTSMASPHSAGATVLVQQVRPDWTDAEILSALATTANVTAFKEDAVTLADPFDVGGGIIQLDQAVNAGLLLDETAENFQAADPVNGGDPKTLNVAGLVNRACVLTCSWSRTFEAVASGTWSVTTSDPFIVATPTVFTLSQGETQEVLITANSADLPRDQWVHSAVNFASDNGFSDQHLTVSFVPEAGSLPDVGEIVTNRDLDSFLITDITSLATDELQVNVAGLVSPQTTSFDLPGDSDNSDAFDDVSDGVGFEFISVPEDAVRLMAFTSDETSSAEDVDLYLGIDLNGNGQPDEDELSCFSTTESATEFCDLTNPAAGDWWVLVQNWGPSDEDAVDNILLSIAVINSENTNNFSVEAPTSVTLLDPFDIRIFWDLPGSVEGDQFFGVILLGSRIDAPDDIGMIPVTIVRAQDDVSFVVDEDEAEVGDKLQYTVEIFPNFSSEDRIYTITANIPDGLAVDEDSITEDGVLAADNITWTVEMLIGDEDEVELEFEGEVEPSAAGTELITELVNAVDSIGTVDVILTTAVTIEGDAINNYEGEFIGPIVNGRNKGVGIPLIIRMQLSLDGVQTTEAEVIFQVTDLSGTVLFSEMATVIPTAGGSYALDIPTDGQFEPGDYIVQAIVEGQLVESTTITLVRMARIGIEINE